MMGTIHRNKVIFQWGAVIFLILGCFQEKVLAQGEETASAIRRYKQYEVSTGYYEEHEALPRHQRPAVPGRSLGRRLLGFPYSPSASSVRNRSRLSDSHMGIKFYWGRRCEECHIEQSRDMHTVRANLTCRQCHGGEPIASIDHYFSSMNPIRRHAYVCAKCHEGASASYARYIIHEPPAGSLRARNDFPVLYYAYWFMMILLVGTLGIFIPHSFLVGLKELLGKKRKTEK
jgi:hypothetical protein